jgi:hypothetical protein
VLNKCAGKPHAIIETTKKDYRNRRAEEKNFLRAAAVQAMQAMQAMQRGG